MNMIRCPSCDNPLPDEAHYCTLCGESMTSPGHLAISDLGDLNHEETLELDLLEEQPTLAAVTSGESTYQDSKQNRDLQPKELSARSTIISGASRGGRGLITVPLPEEQLIEQEDDEESIHGTWHKDVTPTPNRARAVYPPRPVHSNPRMKVQGKGRLSPTLALWTSLLVIAVIVLGGVFGVVVTHGRGKLGIPNQKGLLTLQIAPSDVAVGATMTLRGTNFSPHGRIGLTRDLSVPVVDTAGAVVVEADSKGSFTDTAVITGDWGAGIHTLNAEDAVTHRVATFPVTVTGQNASLRPAHLRLNVTSLDLGSDDPLNNSAKTVSLVNMGGGQVSWQSSADQSWLMVSPAKGNFSSGQSAQVTIGVDRQNMQPGSYTAQVTFTSNGGTVTLPVKMQVLAALPHTAAALALSPSLLSFTGVDGGTSPGNQTVTITNPGMLPLQWSASSDQNWLSIAQSNGTVPASGNQSIAIRVNSSTMLPGTYKGIVTIATGGNAQSVYVNVTINAGCVLQTSPNTLTFTGVYQRTGTLSQSVNVGTAGGCTSAVHWNASSNASWLSISAHSGSASTNPTVSVNTTGMSPGVHRSSIDFISQAGTVTLPVTFTVGQSSMPSLSTSSGGLTFYATRGQSSPNGQGITLTNNGGSVLNWSANSSTSVGGGWLGVSPNGGSLNPGQSATLSVDSTLLNSLVPGTYDGAITVKGTDNSGGAVPGSPKTIAVSFVVGATCSFAVNSGGLNFSGTTNQSAPITIATGGNCAHALNWTASVAGGKWLSVASNHGTITNGNGDSTSVSVAPAGLNAGTYNGTVTIAASDSVTGATIGSPRSLNVTLTVQQSCSLQAPSTSSLNFNANAGTNPATQSFSISATGSCNGGIALTPKISLDTGSGWLNVSPGTTKIASGGSATFTAQAKTAGLSAGKYTGTISLGAANGGTSINVVLNVASVATPTPTATSAPTLSSKATPTSTPAPTATLAPSVALGVNPSSVTFNVTTGTASQPVSISNDGGGSLNWSASLASGTPKFVSLSATTGSRVAGGASASLNVDVDATGLKGGTTYNGTLLVNAVDAATGKAASGSPISVPITINIATPAIQLSANSLTFNATSGTGAPAQSIVVSNGGGDGLSWTVGKPSQSWLQVSPLKGSNTSSTTSTITLYASAASLSAGQYSAQVTITPSSGSPVTVNVTFTVTAPAATATPTSPPAQPPPATASSPPATPTAAPTASPPPTAAPTPSPIRNVAPTPTPSSAPTATPAPTSSPSTAPATPTPSTNKASSSTNATPTSVPTATPTPNAIITSTSSDSRAPKVTPTSASTVAPTPTTKAYPTVAPTPTPKALPTVTPTVTPRVHKHK